MSVLTPRMRAAYRSFRNYRARNRAAWALGAMEDALLKDIGISRSEIHSVVHSLVPGHEDRAR